MDEDEKHDLVIHTMDVNLLIESAIQELVDCTSILEGGLSSRETTNAVGAAMSVLHMAQRFASADQEKAVKAIGTRA